MINAEYMNKAENVYVDGGTSIMELPELTFFDGEQYDIYDQKDYGKFIQDIERAVRVSYEYSALINYLRTSEGMNCCSILQNVSNLDSTKVKIEIHHAVLNLFDIVSTVVKKRLHNKESIDIFDCCKEVMWLHYIGQVALIPLSETVHKLVHNGYIFIPTNIVRGNWKKFIEIYYDYLDPDILDAIDSAELMTQEYLNDISGLNNQVAQQMAIFNLHQTYLKIKNRSNDISGNRGIIKDRITEIKSNRKKLYTLVDSEVRKTNIIDIINAENIEVK